MVSATLRQGLARVRRVLPNVRVVALNVGDSASVAGLTAALEDVALDLLVNNAGIRPEQCGPDCLLDEIDYDAMANTLSTNAVGPCRVLAAALPALARAPRFAVLNVSSGLGSAARVCQSRVLFRNLRATDLAYRASKAALNMATACAALELSERYPNSVVVAMDPGYCKTHMGRRGGRDDPPMEVAASIEGQLRVLETLTPADTGKFINFDGTELPW
ncbi:hypothetical protein CTAYLR_003901 [Chrysophaeum taylorii]|uniref:Uncharacterized protein n=1 Tax=Chrysophaeum taylorii TaxID=2483200 RepID=A0AAD7XQ62_9STRA|nr:hypothetical protein CTAYLR_003901 [Chrysophaeum taylorii]